VQTLRGRAIERFIALSGRILTATRHREASGTPVSRGVDAQLTVWPP
jgi:hypothetical protein